MEEPANGILVFLDVLVQDLPSSDFETSVYRKESDVDVVLHFDSNHATCDKRNCIKVVFGRVDTHCSSDEARRQEKTCLYRLFYDNVYPLKHHYQDPPTNMANPALRPGSIRTDNQTPTTPQPHHRLQANRISLQSTGARKGHPFHPGTAECRV